MSERTTPPAVVQRALDLVDEIGDGAHITNVDVDMAGNVGVDTPTPTVEGSMYILSDNGETYHINAGTCSCGEGDVDRDSLTTTAAFQDDACEHMLSALDARPFDGICECGHAEYHVVDVYANGEPTTGQPRCAYCNRERVTEFHGDSDAGAEPDHYVEHNGRIIDGPMTRTEAQELVVETAALDVTAVEDHDPICQECGTTTEVATRSNNITGRLCPVCDDPTVEFTGD